MSNTKMLGQLVKHLRAAGVDPLRPKIDSYMLKRGKALERLEFWVVDLSGRPRLPGRFSPSNLNGCERQAAFSFVGMKGIRKIDPESEMVLDMGTWTHEMFYAMFYDMELVLGVDQFEVLTVEHPVEIPGLYVAGTSDATFRIDGKKFLWDGKTINNYGFKQITLANAPHPKHKAQMLGYMKAHKIPTGMICYINKERQHLKVFKLRFDSEFWQDTVAWTERVVALMEKRKLPRKHVECRKGNFVYERCPFSRYCFGDMDEEDVETLMYKRFKGVQATWDKYHNGSY